MPRQTIPDQGHGVECDIFLLPKIADINLFFGQNDLIYVLG